MEIIPEDLHLDIYFVVSEFLFAVFEDVQLRNHKAVKSNIRHSW